MRDFVESNFWYNSLFFCCVKDMCGIAGYYNTTVPHHQMRDVMARLHHRGPDDQRVYVRNDVGLIHTRLAIIDLSSLGSQPYQFENLVLVFNGELYNYKEVREDLRKLGYDFQSNSDTEVLVKSFHCWGEECVQHFIGMFAFCIYDELKDEIFLFRDRVGVKPLYYSLQLGVLFFASELSALSAFPITREIDENAVSLYFRFGFIPHHLSIYKSVSKLEPGHYAKISRKGFEKVKYWNPNEEIIHGRNENEWLDELEALLTSAFRYRMVSDVPVGVFLSGGIDSSLVAAILKKQREEVHSFTIGFRESAFDESVFAQQVADHLHTHHTQKILGLEAAHDLLTNFYSIYDEPFADTSGIPTACVTRVAKDNGMKVVLSADGGDELFGGYVHYLKAVDLFKKFSRLPTSVRHGLWKGSKKLFPARLRKRTSLFNLEHKSYAFEEIIAAQGPVEFFEAFLANQSVDELSNMLHSVGASSMGLLANKHNLTETMMAWDFNYYLPDDLLVKVDRATMFHSIECREPFLDHRLVEFTMRLPTELKIKNGQTKYLLRKLLSRYVPKEYLNRKKQGFSIPIFDWFSKDLDVLFKEFVTPDKLRQIPFFNVSEIMREYSKYQLYKNQGRDYNMEKMWRILSFMLWWDKYQSNVG